MKDITLICMIGAPCSGKSTWIEENLGAIRNRHQANVIIVSRDRIREKLYGKRYNQTEKQEREVTKYFYQELSRAIALPKAVVIIDNCNMSATYINDIMSSVRPMMKSGDLKLYFQVLEISYTQAFWRNVRRYFKTGRWIPLKVLKSFYHRYHKLHTVPIFQYAASSSYSDAIANIRLFL